MKAVNCAASTTSAKIAAAAVSAARNPMAASRSAARPRPSSRRNRSSSARRRASQPLPDGNPAAFRTWYVPEGVDTGPSGHRNADGRAPKKPYGKKPGGGPGRPGAGGNRPFGNEARLPGARPRRAQCRWRAAGLGARPEPESRCRRASVWPSRQRAELSVGPRQSRQLQSLRQAACAASGGQPRRTARVVHAQQAIARRVRAVRVRPDPAARGRWQSRTGRRSRRQPLSHDLPRMKTVHCAAARPSMLRCRRCMPRNRRRISTAPSRRGCRRSIAGRNGQGRGAGHAARVPRCRRHRLRDRRRAKADLSNFVVVMRLDASGKVARTWRRGDSPLALCVERNARGKILFVPPRNPFYTSLEISFVP